jgi:hypothetical protein
MHDPDSKRPRCQPVRDVHHAFLEPRGTMPIEEWTALVNHWCTHFDRTGVSYLTSVNADGVIVQIYVHRLRLVKHGHESRWHWCCTQEGTLVH